jgi:hypothetical protein
MGLKLEQRPINVDIVTGVTCDVCDYVMKAEPWVDGKYSFDRDFMTIKTTWGYSSQDEKGESMDGDVYVAVICDRCFKPAMAKAGIKLHGRNMIDLMLCPGVRDQDLFDRAWEPEPEYCDLCAQGVCSNHPPTEQQPPSE